MKKSTIYFLVIASSVLLVLFTLFWIIAGPSAPIEVSTSTTRITSPLRSDGLVNYEQAIVDLQTAGVTPDENAAIPFLQAMWPCELSPEDQALLCEALQMPLPDSPGMTSAISDENREAVVSWLNQQLAAKYGDDGFKPLENEDGLVAICEAYEGPWTREQLPPLADWIDQQKPHFDKLHEMINRPKYALTFPTLLKKKDGFLFETLMHTEQARREAYRCLTARAMLQIGEGEPRAAWEDVKTMFELSRCHNRPPFLIELLVSVAIRGGGFGALRPLLDSGQCDPELLREIEQYLAQLPPYAEMAEAIDTTERFMGLDGTILISTDPIKAQEVFDSEAITTITWAPFDRNATLRALNQWYDRMVAALETEDPVTRQQLVDQIELDLETDAATISSRENLTAAVFSQTKRGELLARIFAALFLPSISQVSEAEDRVNADHQLMRVAVALEIAKAETGDYPDSLDALAAKVDPALLDDPYAAGQFRYERRPPGYLLYSLFFDRVDDGGSSTHGEISGGEWLPEPGTSTYPAGDMVIRFPMPKKTFLDPPPWSSREITTETDESQDLMLGVE